MIAKLDHSIGKPRQFVITTSKSVLLVEPHLHRVQRLHSGSGLYYGIDVSPQNILVAARNRMVSSSISPDSERGEILVFEPGLQFVESIKPPFPLRDLHQIRRIGNRLFATCSFDNMIAIFQDNIWMKWWPLGRPLSGPADVNHFNSIEFVDGRLCLLAHNLSRPSEILVCNRDTLEIEERLTLGSQAHNIWKQTAEWCTCDSANGRLAGSAGFEVITGGFPRGISIGEDFSLVGISEIAERGERDLTNAEIAIYDKGWKKIDSICLPNEGLILDISALS